MFCPECGNKLPDDSIFCENCGTRVAAPEPYTEDFREEMREEVPERPREEPRRGYREDLSEKYPRKPATPRPVYDAPAAPKKGGFPLIAVVGLLAAAVIGGGIIMSGKGKTDPGSGSAQAKTEASGKTGSSSGGSFGGGQNSGGQGSGSVTDEQLNAAINVLTGGVGADDLSKIKVPAGAQIKTDADLTDLIGEYAGEIQMTVLDGFDQIDGIPASFEAERARALKEPLPCELEIEDDGDWTISWKFMNDMTFRSRDFRNPEEFTPEEIQAILITRPAGGLYHAKMDKTAEENGEKVRMAVDHIGAYCTDGTRKMMAGNFLAHINMYGALVTLQGDFLVDKTSEEFVKEDQVQTAQNPAETQSQDIPQGLDNGSSGSSQASANSGNGGVSADMLGKKAEALAKRKDKETSSVNNNLPDGMNSYDPSTYAMKGGKWEQLQDGAYLCYDGNGNMVTNTWVEDGGKYYYLGPDGTMIRNNYAMDGCWAGDDGAWDPSVAQRQDDPEPKNGSYVGYVSTWKVKITKDGAYGKATFDYTMFGGTPHVYTLCPMGHGSYIAESDTEPEWKALMSISPDGKTMTVSQAGITEVCELK